MAATEVIHAEARGRYGSPRMTAEPNARGHACSENTVAKLMREHGIRARAPRRVARATDSRHGLPVAGNVLDREFEPGGPNAVWAADITYIPAGEGWRYLAVVEDLFSRMVVGWAVDDSMGSRRVVGALDMALARRRPGAGRLAHSDRGGQYASAHYQGVPAREGITCSMGRVGQCWDNAPVESFFGRLKCEVAPGEVLGTRDQVKAAIFEYVEVFYNRVRRHSSLGFLSPVEYERTHNQKHP